MFKRNNLAALAAFSAMMLPQPAFAAGLNGHLCGQCPL